MRERGMTLIELMVAMSLLGLMATMVAFSSPGSRARADAAQRRGDSLKMRALVQSIPVLDSIDGRGVLYMPDGRVIEGRRP